MSTNPTLRDLLVAGRYRLGQRLGAGSFGIVLEATDEDNGRQVAVKILRPQFARDRAAETRFRAEATTAASLSHPNLNAVYDWGVERIEGVRVPYLVLERLTGGSLRDILDRGRLLSPSQALMVGLEVCRGLDYMHRHGVVHRDLKPANLAFGEDRRVRILDVGLSRYLSEHVWAEPTAAGLDAARYASPEEAKGATLGDGTLTSATDIYSLCLVLIEAVTGQVPFSADSTVATLNARIDKLMPVSADFGPLAPVLSRAGDADPANRYTAPEFGRALVQAAEKLPRPAPLPIVGTGSSVTEANTVPLQRPAALRPTTPDAGPPPDLVAGGAVIGSNPAVAEVPTVVDQPEPASVEPARPPAADLADELPPPPPPPPDVEMVPLIDGGAPPPPRFDTLTGLPLEPPSLTAIAVAPFEPLDNPNPADLHIVPDAGPPLSPIDFPDDDLPGGSRRRLGVFLALVVLIAALAVGGILVYNKIQNKSYAVPDLAGMPQAVALNQVAGNGWDVSIASERSDERDAGLVIRTDPPAGSKLRKGGDITLVVSEGPTLATLPEITGQPLEAAQALLTADKLAITVSDEVYNEDVPAGSIISWSVPAQPSLTAGAQVMQNTAIAAVVSKGPNPRVVPKLVGLDLATATAALADIQLVIVQDPSDVFSDLPAGTVAEQSIPAGTAVTRGDTVTVALSKGPELTAVPALAGLSYDQIVAALEAARLHVGTVTGDQVAGTIMDATVGGVSVQPNQQFPVDTSIDLVFSTPPPPTQAPTTTTAPATTAPATTTAETTTTATG
jgi:serine/threonine-protein kinase